MFATVLPLILGLCNVSWAGMITLGPSPSQSIQILALGGGAFEIQLGGGNNQPPADTFITGSASFDSGSNIFTGFYQLSTDPSQQLRITNTVVGTAGGADDSYDFLAGYDLLHLIFAPTMDFSNPFLVADFTLAYATQQVPGNAGNKHPPSLIFGTMGNPSGGSLADQFQGGATQLVLNIGENQRLLDLAIGNTASGMNLQNGSVVPEPSSLVLFVLGLSGVAMARRARG